MEGDVLKIDKCTSSSGTPTVVSEQGDLFGSMVNVGCMIGALCGSYLTNKIGRKHSIIAAGIPFMAGYALLAVADQFWLVLTARILTGLAVGIVSMAVCVFFIHPQKMHI